MRISRAIALGAIITSTCFSTAIAADCPPYTHMDDVTEGSAADLPSGWFVYAVDAGGAYQADPLNKPGIFISALQEHSPAFIPGTESDAPSDIDITSDGKWILYWATNSKKLYIIRPDGTGKTEVPIAAGQCGWYRESPYGLEIYSTTTEYYVLSSITVNLEDDPPTFGQVRKIVEFGGSAKAPGGQTVTPQFHEPFVHSDHVFAGRILSPINYRTLVWLTIPNDGKGTATYADRWEYIDPPAGGPYGCGRTMSHDGKIVAFGPGSQGNQDCVPNRINKMDHKGFVVVPFQKVGDPPLGFHEIIDEHALSIVWVPKKYRFGLFNEVDFTEWYICNNSDYVVGVQKGSKGTCRGVWLCRWESAVWTLLTPCGTFAHTPAVHFDMTDASHGPWPKAVHAAARSGWRDGQVEVFTLHGRRIGAGKDLAALQRTLRPGAYVAIRREDRKAVMAITQ